MLPLSPSLRPDDLPERDATSLGQRVQMDLGSQVAREELPSLARHQVFAEQPGLQAPVDLHGPMF